MISVPIRWRGGEHGDEFGNELNSKLNKSYPQSRLPDIELLPPLTAPSFGTYI